eukprot:363895-Chlamydomonas_euryale.AAC.2
MLSCGDERAGGGACRGGAFGTDTKQDWNLTKKRYEGGGSVGGGEVRLGGGKVRLGVEKFGWGQKSSVVDGKVRLGAEKGSEGWESAPPCVLKKGRGARGRGGRDVESTRLGGEKGVERCAF